MAVSISFSERDGNNQVFNTQTDIQRPNAQERIRGLREGRNIEDTNGSSDGVASTNDDLGGNFPTVAAVQGQPLNGTEDDDFLEGESGNDTLNGLGGDDLLVGNAGDDLVDGSGGNDILRGDSGVGFSSVGSNDTLLGGPGNDNLTGSAGDDLLNGGQGEDFIDGGDGNDEIIAGINDDIVRAGAGNDTIDGGTGNNQLFGEAGDDEIVSAAGNDVLNGGDGSDSLLADGGDDLVLGGDGNDTIVGGQGNNQLLGNNGDDVITALDGEDLLNGGSGDDILSGGGGDDELIGGTNSRDPVTGEFIGGDLLNGEGGDDLLTGGFGNDSLAGGGGNDLIAGSFGENIILAGGGNDTVTGGVDEDTIFGESDDDLILGSGGNDEIYGDRDLLSAPDGSDNIIAGSGNDSIAAGGGADSVRGGLGNDIVDGGDGSGNFFRDLEPGLEGGFDPTLGPFSGGDDEVFGSEGDDTVIGGFGSDTVDGGGTLAGEFDVLYGGQLTYSVSNVIDDETGEEIPVIESQGITSESLLGLAPVEDTFVLGTETGFKYAGGTGELGIADRAVIFDFQPGVDRIQVTLPSVVTFDNGFLAIDPGDGNVEIIAQLVGITEFNPGDLIGNQLGTEGDDSLTGGAGADTLDGAEGNDALAGLGGDDTLIGGVGSDFLNGRGVEVGEVDLLIGGESSSAANDGVPDLYVLGNANASFYTGGDEGGVGFGFGDRAIIQGFDPGVDRIRMSAATGIQTILPFGSNSLIVAPTNEIIAEVVGVAATDLSNLLSAGNTFIFV